MDALTRNHVRERANQRCEYCRVPESAYPISFHVEHIIASVHRRDDDLSNLAWACPRCSAYKGPNLVTLDPESGDQVDLVNPRIHSWEEHFAMEEFRVVGLTPIGRGTVHLLQMNQSQRIDLRRVFMR